MSIWVWVCSLQEYFLSSDCIGDERLTGILDKDKSYGGKIGEREFLCGVLKNSTETSSADNESSPEQLFVLAQVVLKLAHLSLTEIAQCASPNASVYNIVKFASSPTPHCFL